MGDQIFKTTDTISNNEVNLFKLIKMAHGIARSVMYRVFLWGTQQGPDESVEHYLLKTKGYSKTFYKNCFDKYQLELLSDKSLESKLDVTVLSKVIKHTCDKVDTPCHSTTLGLLIKEIKNFRDHSSHNFFGITEEELFSKSMCLLDLLKNILIVAGDLYGKASEAKKETFNIEITIANVREQSLATLDINECQSIVLNEKLKQILKKEGAKELRERYEHMSQLNPVSFLESRGLLFDVNMVFTQIEVENAGQKAKGVQIPCHEILIFCRNNNTGKHKTKILGPEAYLIEGPAGAGKTTLIKYIKSTWQNKVETMEGLNEFDLLLFMECRNSSLSSLSQLLCHLMPKTNATYFRQGELLKHTLDLKTLILVDGLDELNSSSEKLFYDIVNQNNKNLVILCSSRPEKARHFQMHVPCTFHTAHLRITGIADNKKEEFIRKYHGEMQKHGKSKQDTESLISYVKRSESHLKNYYRLPINLVLLTWLWADDPDSVTPLTTSSELYIQTHNLMKKKLLERLAHHEDARSFHLQDLEEKLKQVLCSVYKSALTSLNKDAIESLLPECVDQMIATCVSNSLPPRETLSAFFVIKIVEGNEKVSVPHKLVQDFYAAQCIVQNLFNEMKESQNKDLLQKLAVSLSIQGFDPIIGQAILSKAMTEMMQANTAPKSGSLKTLIVEACTHESGKLCKYQNMLLLVAGIIYALHGSKVEDWIRAEIVELLHNSQFGIDDNNQWFDLFEQTKNDVNVIRHASDHINKAITITEERVNPAIHLLLPPRPLEISLIINRKARDIPELQTLIARIADCESKLNLAFWEDFWNPDSIPSNDEELKIVSQRCSLRQVACHVSGDILAEMRGTSTYLNIAVTNNQTARDVMCHLSNVNPNLQVMGLNLHLTTNVTPESLISVQGIPMLCLAVSGVQDSNLDHAYEIVKALLPQPQDIMLTDLRFPQAEVSFEGWVKLMKNINKDRVIVAHISIPEETVLQPSELDWLKDFAFGETIIRCAFRRISKEQMREDVFSLAKQNWI